MCPSIRRDHEQTTTPEPLTWLQSEGGAGAIKGIEHSLNWLSSSTFTPIRSQHGRRSLRTGLRSMVGTRTMEQTCRSPLSTAISARKSISTLILFTRRARRLTCRLAGSRTRQSIFSVFNERVSQKPS